MQKEQSKRTPARSSGSSIAEFLSKLRKVRDESASGFRDDLCSAHTMGEVQRDFAERLKRWREKFPALLTGLAQTLCERGLGEAVEGELENAWSKIKSEANNWIALACDGELPTSAPDWRAPSYLADFPVKRTSPQRHIPIAMMHGRIDANETERIIAAVQTRVEEYRDDALADALDHARRCVAERPIRTVGGQEPEHDEIKRGGRPRQDEERKKIREKRAAGKTWKQVTKEMDAESGNPRTVRAYQYLLRTESPKKKC
jgi:hypothetical protein